MEFLQPYQNKRIIITPLDWGLGHATRCIPIIRHLLRNNCTLVIAGSGSGFALLQKEFPMLPFELLQGYDITYSKRFLLLNLTKQIPKLLAAIKRENESLARLVAHYQPDLILSDNRYGCYHPQVKSIILTHQVNLHVPLAEKIINRVIHQWLAKFNEVWVVDNPPPHQLAGKLSVIPKRLSQASYIGLLSAHTYNTSKNQSPLDVLILLSGPEPQRSLLEKQLLTLAEQSDASICLIQGLPQLPYAVTPKNNIEIHTSLHGQELSEKLNAANLVIARAGYSSIMDLISLKKKAILIPTPGQTEQEYLAEYLKNKFKFRAIRQNQLSQFNSLQQLVTC